MEHSRQRHRKLLALGLATVGAALLASQTLLLAPYLHRSWQQLPSVLHSRPGGEQLASVSQMSSGDVAVTASGLRSVRIEPAGQSLRPVVGTTVRLTSVGLYATTEMPVAAQWYLRAGTYPPEQPIPGCRDAEECAFTAPNQAVDAIVSIEAGGHWADTTLQVIDPTTDLFTDTLPAWAAASIARLSQLAIVRGYDDGRYGPGDPLTHGQVVTLLARLLEHTGLARPPAVCPPISPSVGANHYARPAVCLLTHHQWLDGLTFHPDVPASRGAVAELINRLLGRSLLSATGTAQGAIYVTGQVFQDVPIHHQHFYDIGVLDVSGIMTGHPDGRFGVNDILNRAEAATIIDRLLERIEAWHIEVL